MDYTEAELNNHIRNTEVEINLLMIKLDFYKEKLAKLTEKGEADE